jgi:hypothetical protein
MRTATASRSSLDPMLRATVLPSTGVGNERCDPSGSVMVGMVFGFGKKRASKARGSAIVR